MAKRTAKMVEKFMDTFKDFRPLNGPLADEVEDGTGYWADTGEQKDPTFGWDKQVFILLLENGKLQVESELDIDQFPFTATGVRAAKEDVENMMTELGMYEYEDGEDED